MQLKCPHCSGKLVYLQDAVIKYSIIGNTIAKDGKKYILDNCWLECTECNITSADDYDLRQIEQQLDIRD
jgi:hypothetical protein